MTLNEIHSFYRLFFIPGMHHCSTGPGAWDIGQTYPLNPQKNDTSHNALLSLVDWVENEIVPDALIGTKYENDDTTASVLAERSELISIWRQDVILPYAL